MVKSRIEPARKLSPRYSDVRSKSTTRSPDVGPVTRTVFEERKSRLRIAESPSIVVTGDSDRAVIWSAMAATATTMATTRARESMLGGFALGLDGVMVGSKGRSKGRNLVERICRHICRHNSKRSSIIAGALQAQTLHLSPSLPCSERLKASFSSRRCQNRPHTGSDVEIGVEPGDMRRRGLRR